MATLKDIARECGVTTATVSMTINGKGRIAPETRNRIMEVVQRLNYHITNSGESSLPVTTRTIGLVMPGVWDWAGGFYHRAVKAATQTAATFGYDCKILMQEDIQSRVIDNFHKGRIQLGCDHIVFFCPRPEWTDLLPGLTAWQVRSSVIRRQVEAPGVACFVDDDYRGFRLGMDHLAGLGHRVILLLRPLSGGFEGRLKAYRDVVREHGLVRDERLIIYLEEENFDLISRIRQLKDQGLTVTALACSGDHLAVMAGQALMREGFRVPADISILGYDDDPISRSFYPNITSVTVPVEDMMTAAFRAVIDPAPELSGAKQVITFSNELVVRESTEKLKEQ